jgi:response regulator RpfG family c-di-GMP phosphodiesterase
MKSARILIVEDENMYAEDFKDKLEQLGHKVLAICSSGEQAVHSALALNPDLILMDIYLDGAMDGIEAASVIRARQNIAVIYLTSANDEMTLQRAKITEPFAYIQKPITSQELHVAVEVALYKHTVQKEVSTQLEHLTAMCMVDEAILNNHDPHQALRVALHQITFQLNLDAAAVLLFNPFTRFLEFFEGYGFKTTFFHDTCLRLGEEFVGRSFLKDQIEQVGDLSVLQYKSSLNRMNDEGFMGYVILPLYSKDKLKGILEVFRRTPLDTNSEWLDFLKAMANQAAVAMDNASMMEELRTANLEMIQSYNATIQGWSAALEMRDIETQGHSKRVTEMTLTIAQAMGVREQDLEHIRRGALLHDIGKMGIPDNILLKPGELNPQEWEIMRKHPYYARDLLSFVPFLKPALDIPFYHHERWDGSGYPEGLCGESIPLAARIFAVVDVWDALLSDRPYRQAWTSEAARQFLCQQSGIQFDPQVVETFLKVIS